MLSYQHGYHAGNFADVHKHTALGLVIKHFADHKKVVTFLDSHAGRGLYDLSGDQSTKTGEWQDGYAKIKDASVSSDGLKFYQDSIKSFQEKHTELTYPGSPALTQHLMSTNQRSVLFELHPTEFEELQANLAGDQRLRFIHKDAQYHLIDFLPNRNADGALLIDPSYEIKDDYTTMAKLANGVHKRWKAGVIMIWYPMLPEGRHEDLKAGLKDATFFELIGPKKERGMYGTGLAVINAPDGFDETFGDAEKEMTKVLF
ncbi:23S rRNA (adenine(2030)-N(6))-methyltransferase RlmJ [Terasakiella sp. A23]|uniref:23S rRNA (adenine(2030)-N(6))-methyltransferase RlmJ n=1 Tax=Terasakiella sp. FCG-A23 TaxID=3080561 RepID=UPI002955B5FE|nr:23S rRNA (adenine(2030)-N(6))-methyltransferase RlmJ [Terasakiella sp. A23]MDV7341418.1 23S rRNA (adenine(2030)-N(6))-methyltransferase RlmJ [Terasakiella sp. A23]